MDTCLRSTFFIDADHEAVRRVAEDLTSGLLSDCEKGVRLYYFVRDLIRYNPYMISTHRDDFRASLTLERGQGYCVQKAILLTALGRAVGIPARLAFAKIRNHRLPNHLREAIGTDILPAHGFSQLYIQGRWLSVTPAFDRELCAKNSMPPVEFDGGHDALLAPFDGEGKPFIEYLEKYEPQEDLPLAWLTGRVRSIWGHKRSWINEQDSEGHTMASGFRFQRKEKVL
ncbi:MAG TPA: transglutaminase-like domain-containing protein [Syntrophorhabdaceae bacterium]|jgi:transglutaminase-like putative cysteine protease